MGDQDKSLFARQIVTHQPAGGLVQVVGRFIDKKKTVFLGEQSGQQNFSPLAQGKSDIGPAIGFLFDLDVYKRQKKGPPTAERGAF